MRRLTAQLALHITTASRTDGELLTSFVTAGTEADFAELVRRHGPMVWGVCRRALPDLADAEDAFQAVFLVLLRRANRLTASQTVGPWLHRVAVWTARNVRRRNARRLAKRVPISDQLAASRTDPDLPLDLDAALLSLPDKYRSPVVLCHLLGYTRTEAAHELGCPEGTLSAWLSRGLAKLRAKLGGLDPAKALAVAAVSVPTTLWASVVRSAVASHVSAAATSTVSQIVEGVLHMFWVKKATAASAALVAVFALGMGVGLSTRHGVGVAEAQVKSADNPSPAKTASPSTKLDEDIAKLEAELLAAQAGLNAARTGIKLTEEKIAVSKDRADISEMERLNDQITLARFKENEAQAAKRLLEVKHWLEKYEAAKRDPEVLRDIDLYRRQIELEAIRQVKIAELARQRKALADYQEALKLIPKDIAAEEQALKDTEAGIARVLADRATLAKESRVPPADHAGYVELTLHGKGRNFEFAIKETDAASKEIGTVVVREPAMLTKLLMRIRNDPAAPKQLRVVADPSLSLNGYFTVGLKACESAGFKTVTFTGYMPKQVLRIPALKSDHKGDAPGYKRYDAVERDTASLIKEVEDWMRTW
jgi:RNA polymerase sigma factor (sigma-70 family)